MENMKALVYVLAKDGEPLMPCEPVIARLLLKQGKAKVKRREPFTIKLMYESDRYTQPLTLGVDTGSGIFGTAAAMEDGSVVYASEVTVRNDVHGRMERRKGYRRSRRGRKTRYRKPRFRNRRNSIRKDRFPPTMVSKQHSHEKEIAFVCSILPITELVIEGGLFDPHLLKNPALHNPVVRSWGCQKGLQYGFANVKAAVRARDRYTCRLCGKTGGELQVHHIMPRSEGGTDIPENLVTLCPKCHAALHVGKLRGEKKKKAEGLLGGPVSTLKYATQMNSIRKQLLRNHPEAIETFGYVTSENRIALGLRKNAVKFPHALDAAVIAAGGRMPVWRNNAVLKKVCIPEGDIRQTHGLGSEQKLTTGKTMGFRKFDKVLYRGRAYFLKGRMSTGYGVLMDIDGRKQKFDHLPGGQKTPKLANMKRLASRKSWMTETCVMH